MSKRAFLLALVSAFALSTLAPAVVFAQSTSSVAETSAAIQSSVAKRLAIPESSVAVTIKTNMIDVSIRDSRQEISTATFHGESYAIEEEVVRKIAANDEYKRIHSIHITHVLVLANGKHRILHTIDYIKNTHGVFEPHMT